jgi:hypothetical protein
MPLKHEDVMAETDFISTAEDKKFDKQPSLEKDEAIEKVVDYRGDVTLGLKDGTVVVGYVYNREPKAAEPYLEIIPADKEDKVKILYKNLASVYFSGIDTASGRSWAAWVERVEKYKAKEQQS